MKLKKMYLVRMSRKATRSGSYRSCPQVMLASNMDEFQRMIDTESTDGVWAAQGDDK